MIYATKAGFYAASTQQPEKSLLKKQAFTTLQCRLSHLREAAAFSCHDPRFWALIAERPKG